MKWKKLVLVALAATMAIGAAGCGSQQKADAGNGSAVSGSITGSGSSALLPLVKDAAEKFKTTNKDVTITLNAGGSGTGLKQVSDGSVDMGNSDVPAETKLDKAKAEKLEDLYAGTEFASRFDADAGSSIVLMEKQIDSLFSKWKSLAMDSYEAYREWGDAYEKGFALEYIRNALSLKDDNELKKIKSLLEK